MRILTTLAIAATVALAAVVAGTRLALREAAGRTVGHSAAEALRGTARVFAALEQADVETLDATLARLLSDPAIADAFAARDRARLAALVVPRFRAAAAGQGVAQWNFLLPDRTLFLRAQRPAEFGDLIERRVVVEAARSGDLAVGKDLGRTGFGLRLARPWAPRGAVLGYVEIGEEAGRFLARLKALTGDDCAIVVEKRHLDRAEWAGVRAAAGKGDGWDELPGAVILETTGLDGSALAGWRGTFESLPRDGELIGSASRGGKAHALGLAPLTNAAGERVGALLVAHDTTTLGAGLAADARGVLWRVGALTALALAALVVLACRHASARRGAAPPST